MSALARRLVYSGKVTIRFPPTSVHCTVVLTVAVLLTGLYRSGFDVADRSIQAKISRADMADFMLGQLTDDVYLRKTPGVSY